MNLTVMKTFASLIGFLIINGPLQVAGVKESYYNQQKVAFSISNTTSNKYYATVALEKNVAGEWREVMIDISRKSLKSTTRYHILNDNTKRLDFDLKNIGQGMFRFRIDFGEKMVLLSGHLYSNPFTVSEATP